VIGALRVSWRNGDSHWLMSTTGVSKNSKTAVSIKAGMLGYAHGRAVAALARVSCRQLGLGPATVVGNCRSLRMMMQAAGDTPPFTPAQMEQLCPDATTSNKHICPILQRLEINVMHPPPPPLLPFCL
jgi:hypothetical protein